VSRDRQRLPHGALVELAVADERVHARNGVAAHVQRDRLADREREPLPEAAAGEFDAGVRVAARVLEQDRILAEQRQRDLPVGQNARGVHRRVLRDAAVALAQHEAVAGLVERIAFGKAQMPRVQHREQLDERQAAAEVRAEIARAVAQLENVAPHDGDRPFQRRVFLFGHFPVSFRWISRARARSDTASTSDHA